VDRRFDCQIFPRPKHKSNGGPVLDKDTFRVTDASGRFMLRVTKTDVTHGSGSSRSCRLTGSMAGDYGFKKLLSIQMVFW